ncbi:STAS domain-containing protein [Streptomyces sp. NPDC006670]|uniref:STAS domain-containing protein n=1 Tax=Streptomyces sp. NPDC006670 TaxID=3154476 RepID=UPI0033DC703B
MISDKDRTGTRGASGPGPYVVRISGEMDFDHAEQLGTVLRAAVVEAADGSDILIDLRDSSFCDSAGLNALLTARRQARTQGHLLVLAAPSHQMIRLLAQTGATDLFALSPAPPNRPPTPGAAQPAAAGPSGGPGAEDEDRQAVLSRFVSQLGDEDERLLRGLLDGGADTA